MLLVPYLDRFKASSHSVTFGKQSCRLHKTAAGAPTAQDSRRGSDCPGTSRRGCRHMSTEPSSGSDRKQPQKEVQGREMWRWGEKRDLTVPAQTAARQETGTRARPDASQHTPGTATARMQAGDELAGSSEPKRVSEAVRLSPGSTHAGAGVPVTAAEDRLRLYCRDS